MPGGQTSHSPSPVLSARVLVAGGAGRVGAGVSRALALAGATVMVADRDRPRLEALALGLADKGSSSSDGAAASPPPPQKTGSLHPFFCELSSTEDVASLATRLQQKWGGVDAVVIALGGWLETGPLGEIDVLARWEEIAGRTLLPHLLVTRHFLPLLRAAEKPRYLLIAGSTAEHPHPGAGLVSVAAAAQRMVARVIEEEEGKIATAILELAGPVRADDSTAGDPGWMDATTVGRLCARWLSGKDFPRGRLVSLADARQLGRWADGQGEAR